jgi:hypothetical protein
MARPVGKFEIYVPNKLEPPTMSIKPICDQIYIVTHNWGDKTTWYQEAIKVTQKTLTRDGGDGRIYHSSEPNWIDASHGKLYMEDWVLSYGTSSFDFSDYKIIVTVDDVEKTESTIDSDAWPNTDGDFYVDYENGDVKFDEDPGASAVVKATYYKVDPAKSTADQSRFTVKPESGHMLRIEKVEVQFTKGINLSDTMVSAAFAPLPPTYEVGEVPDSRAMYKSFMDYLNEAQGNYPVVPSGFITGSRGLNVDMIQLPWNWLGIKLLKSSQLAEIRMWLENGNVFTNGIATATFYCQTCEE